MLCVETVYFVHSFQKKNHSLHPYISAIKCNKSAITCDKSAINDDKSAINDNKSAINIEKS